MRPGRSDSPPEVKRDTLLADSYICELRTVGSIDLGGFDRLSPVHLATPVRLLCVLSGRSASVGFLWSPPYVLCPAHLIRLVWLQHGNQIIHEN